MTAEFTSTSNKISATTPQALRPGFGSYLSGILPSSIATACGALRVSMLQVRNIRNIPTTKFAQAVSNLEIARDLQVGGTNVPADTSLANSSATTLGQGSGPNGTYTLSDFFGCVSGLPHNNHLLTLQKILQDTILANIYHELYLATTWRAATVTVSTVDTAVSDGVGGFNYFYQVTGITLTDAGGGYGRGSAPQPQIVISGTSGATATVTNWITSKNSTIISSFGRIIGVTLTNGGTNTLYGNGPSATPPPSGIVATIEAPPTLTPGPVGTTLPGGYNNTAPGTIGWPGMNSVVQNYIDQANTRIFAWSNANTTLASTVNQAWNALGTQLKIEQRSRNTALYPLPSPKSALQPLSQSPNTQITWVDALRDWSAQTQPHQHAQTLEAISNWTTIGGQSIVAALRQERNAARLQTIGVDLDNNIPTTDQTINRKFEKALIANDRSAGLYVGPTTLGASDVVDTSNAAAIQKNQSLGHYDVAINTYNVNDINYGLTTLDTGDSDIPGSFAGSEYVDLIDPQLNAAYISSQLTPATYTVPEAVAEVEKCNCDCWENE